MSNYKYNNKEISKEDLIKQLFKESINEKTKYALLDACYNNICYWTEHEKVNYSELTEHEIESIDNELLEMFEKLKDFFDMQENYPM